MLVCEEEEIWRILTEQTGYGAVWMTVVIDVVNARSC